MQMRITVEAPVFNPNLRGSVVTIHGQAEDRTFSGKQYYLVSEVRAYSITLLNSLNYKSSITMRDLSEGVKITIVAENPEIKELTK